MGLDIKSIRYAHGPGHTDICLGIDNRYVYTCGSDGYVRVWDGPNDDDSSSEFVADQAISVTCLQEKFLVATSNNYVQSYTLDRKREKVVFRFSAPVTHVTASRSGKFIAASSCDMEIQVLETITNRIITLTGHKAPVLGISLDPLDEYLASSSCDGTIRLWDLLTGVQIKCFTDVVPVKNDFFKAVVLARSAWKTENGLFLAIPKGLQVVIYKRNSWIEVCSLSSKNIEKELSAVLFSPCGNYLAAASIAGEIMIWTIKHKSEVCYYKDPKKVGISGMVWNPDGNEILLCDRLGRLGVLSGIIEEISKHNVPTPSNTLSNDVDESSQIIDSNSYFDNDCDEENCISLEKIKSQYMNLSNDKDDEDDNASMSSSSSLSIKEHLYPQVELQSAFQPSSTPSNFEPRCLCYNEIGIVRYYDSDKTIDIQFHDATLHHSLFLRSFGTCTIATLSLNVLCLAVPSIDDKLSKLTCISLGSWAGNKEWTSQMPQNEDIMAVAASSNWVAVATSNNNLRIFSHAGTQKQVLALPGPVVSLAGWQEKLLVVCHTGLGLPGSQNLGFIIYNISNIYVRAKDPFQCLPLSPKSTLKWLGFTDEGTPSTYDSEGILRVLGHDDLHWMVICDTKSQRKNPSDNYFVVGLNETNQNVRCILCSNSAYPSVTNNPTVVEISMKIPLCEMDDAKSIAEESFWRLMFSLHNIQKIGLDSNDIFKNFELPMKQAVLKLFGEACNNSEDLRAVDLATFMTKQALDIALKYATNQGKTYLVEKVKSLKPIDWSYDCLLGESISFNELDKKKDNTDFDDGLDVINSQQDLFEDCPRNSNLELRTSSSVKSASESISKPLNPFKKSPANLKENPKGLNYFNTLTKELPPQNKSYSINKPLKLVTHSNKDKNATNKMKNPTFVEWFSKKKAALMEEYVDVPPNEFTKMSMKIYKEEMKKLKTSKELTSDGAEGNRKRSPDEENVSEAKRLKNVNDSS